MSGDFIEGAVIGLVVGGALASWFWIRHEERLDQEELEADLALMSDEERAKFESAMKSAWENVEAEARAKRQRIMKRVSRLFVFWRR